MRPTSYVSPRHRRLISCMQLTDRHIYFMLEDARRRRDVPLFEDVENAQELPPPMPLTIVEGFGEVVGQGGGCSSTKPEIGC